MLVYRDRVHPTEIMFEMLHGNFQTNLGHKQAVGARPYKETKILLAF